MLILFIKLITPLHIIVSHFKYLLIIFFVFVQDYNPYNHDYTVNEIFISTNTTLSSS